MFSEKVKCYIWKSSKIIMMNQQIGGYHGATESK